MRRPLTWFLVSVACFLAAWFFWGLGDERSVVPTPATRTNAAPVMKKTSRAAAAPAVAQAPARKAAPVIYPKDMVLPGTSSSVASAKHDSDYRLRNTTEEFETLAQKNTALLMRNAMIDTAG